MSMSVTTDKFIAWYTEFGTFYEFVKSGFINCQNIKCKLSKKLTLSSSTYLTRLLMFKQAVLKPRLAYWKDPNYLNELRCLLVLATFEKLEDNRHSWN